MFVFINYRKFSLSALVARVVSATRKADKESAVLTIIYWEKMGSQDSPILVLVGSLKLNFYFAICFSSPSGGIGRHNGLKMCLKQTP